jgi:hypothetical protein
VRAGSDERSIPTVTVAWLAPPATPARSHTSGPAARPEA